jgi:hypothetical protein
VPVLATIFNIILGILWFIEVALIVWVVLSWILLLSQRSKARWRYRGFFHFLEQLDGFLRIILGPFLRLARMILPQRRMPREWQRIDLSPLIVILMIVILRAILLWAFSRILVA